MPKTLVFLLLASLLNLGYADPKGIFPVVENEEKPSSLWFVKKPYPTNAWFINFMLGQENNSPSNPVNLFPYLAQISAQGLSLSYSTAKDYQEPNFPGIVSALYYPFQNQFSIGTAETMTHYGLESFHGLKINLQWENENQQRMSMPIIQGSPYITAIFAKATPKLQSMFFTLSINQQNTAGLLTEASRLEMTFALDKQNTQVWIVYTEKPLTWHWESKDGKTELTATEPYTGWLRVVLQKDSLRQINNDKATLDQYSSTIPLDYQQSYSQKEEDFSYSFLWQTQDGKPPLLLSLPHQRSSFPEKAKVSYQSIKGELLGRTQTQWDIALPKTPILFLEPKKISDEQKEALRKALKEEVTALLARPFPDDGPYQVGKRLGRAARMLLIADLLKEQKLRDGLLTRLKDVLTKKMQDTKGWHFQYDNTWGGIIPSVNDYGARHYNDHHYHYGYWIYAIAVIGKFDPAWLNKPLPGASFTPKEWAEQLILDYANEKTSDPFFPKQRQQEDYLGHSWASGLRSFKDGQNQQSSSEAVNAYYALALFGLSTNNPSLVQWGQFLTARELKAAQLYWQIAPDNTIYPKVFTKNNQVVANLWDSKVDANAFFVDCNKSNRCGLEYSYGIEMLPFTAISSYLLNKDWLQAINPKISQLIQGDEIHPAWQWLLLKGIAPILSAQEKKSFFNKVMDSNIEDYDNGDSKTNTLYFLLDEGTLNKK